MRRLQSFIVLAAFVLAVATLSAAPQNAAAAGLAKRHAKGLNSAQIYGEAIYWFQREATDEDDEHNGGGRVLRRGFGSTTVEQIYSTEDGWGVTGLNVAHGRVLVGESQGSEKASRVIEVTGGEGAWTTSVITQRDGAQSGDTCFVGVEIVAISVAAEAIIRERTDSGRNADCGENSLRRSTIKLIAIARDGAIRTIHESIEGWRFADMKGDPEAVSDGPGDWIHLSRGGEFNSTVALNLANGEQHRMFDGTGGDGNHEISADGRVLESDYGYLPKLRPDPLRPDSMVDLTLPGRRQWMHFCGDRIIEIVRKSERYEAPYPYGPKTSSRWDLWIRTLDGKRERRLPQRLARGTGFEGCDANFAIFHRYRADGKARQFGIPLYAAGATSATGAT